MGHVVLLGDSIFDNARYVPGRPAVIDQLRQNLPAGWQATLLAVDGHITHNVVGQLEHLPDNATHLVVSVGGNDALGESPVLAEPVKTVGEALGSMYDVCSRFRAAYREMLQHLCKLGKTAAVCTIYDAIPGLSPAEQMALAGFNDAILREAFSAGLPVLDLRFVCDSTADYSHVSPIEPSFTGGTKIARLIAEFATNHDPVTRNSIIYR